VTIRILQIQPTHGGYHVRAGDDVSSAKTPRLFVRQEDLTEVERAAVADGVAALGVAFERLLEGHLAAPERLVERIEQADAARVEKAELDVQIAQKRTELADLDARVDAKR
jgi:hypothetical protein